MNSFSKYRKYFNYILLLAEGLLRRCFPHHPQGIPGKQTVLVVRMDLLGDFILWVPFAIELRKFYPKEKYHLVLLGHRMWMPLAEKLLNFDEYIPCDVERFEENYFEQRKILLSLRLRRFDILIHPRFLRLFLTEDMITLFCQAGISWAFRHTASEANPLIRKITPLLYDYLLDDNPDAIHILQRNQVFLQFIIDSDIIAYSPMAVSNKFLLPENLSAHNYFVIMPGASKRYRCWPAERFAVVATHIERITGWVPVLCGSASEIELSTIIENALPGKYYSYTGKTQATELANIIANAKFVIGNESGGIHLAAMAGVNSLCILGGGHWGFFIPYPENIPIGIRPPVCVYNPMQCFNCDWTCSKCNMSTDIVPCINSISVEMVCSVISRILSKEKR